MCQTRSDGQPAPTFPVLLGRRWGRVPAAPARRRGVSTDLTAGSWAWTSWPGVVGARAASAISGAGAALTSPARRPNTVTATDPGDYRCRATATNLAGSSSQTSAPAHRLGAASSAPSMRMATASSPARTATTTTRNIRPDAREITGNDRRELRRRRRAVPALLRRRSSRASRRQALLDGHDRQAPRSSSNVPNTTATRDVQGPLACPFKSKKGRRPSGQESTSTSLASLPRSTRCSAPGTTLDVLIMRAELHRQGRPLQGPATTSPSSAASSACAPAAPSCAAAAELEARLGHSGRALTPSTASRRRRHALRSRRRMGSVALSLVLALVLLAAALLKLAGGARARAALGTYGLHGRAAALAWGGLIAAELRSRRASSPGSRRRLGPAPRCSPR